MIGPTRLRASRKRLAKPLSDEEPVLVDCQFDSASSREKASLIGTAYVAVGLVRHKHFHKHALEALSATIGNRHVCSLIKVGGRFGSQND